MQDCSPVGLSGDGGLIRGEFVTIFGTLAGSARAILDRLPLVDVNHYSVGGVLVPLASPRAAISVTDLPAGASSDRHSDSSPDLGHVPIQPPQKSTPPAAESEQPIHSFPFYTPRIWHGMPPSIWLRLLRGGGFRVHPRRLIHATGSSLASPANTGLALLQKVFFGRKLADAELHGPPVFIIGHWRSGTTMLHELMVLDERLSSPSTFQCFAPHHFLVSEKAFQRFGKWMLPSKRPMDNMPTGWDRPMEDEFALLNMGLPSPYRRIAFPNQGPVDMEYLNFEGVAREDIDHWFAELRKFLLAVSAATERPLVIKSPTHTGRIAELSRAFPEARFIHLTRNPLQLFPSTCRLWRSLDESQALQVPSKEGYEDYVNECYRRMYKAFERDRDSIAPHRLIDVRYDDLKGDPVACLQRIYETLHLSDFETVRPSIQAWVESEHKQYQPNRHARNPQQDDMIRDVWREYFQRYGYE